MSGRMMWSVGSTDGVVASISEACWVVPDTFTDGSVGFVAWDYRRPGCVAYDRDVSGAIRALERARTAWDAAAADTVREQESAAE